MLQNAYRFQIHVQEKESKTSQIQVQVERMKPKYVRNLREVQTDPKMIEHGSYTVCQNAHLKRYRVQMRYNGD